MPFQPGVSGNPGGKPARGISRVVRQHEFRRAFLQLINIRDGRIREMDFDEDGKRRWVYPSVAHLIQACKLIMEYTAGKPEQKISLDVIGEAEKPNALQLVLNAREDGEIHQEDRPRLILSSGQQSPNIVREDEESTEDNKADK